MLTGYFSLGRRPGGEWRIRDIGQNILQSPQLSADPVVKMRSRLSVPFAVQRQLQCFVMTTEWLPLGISVNTL